MLSILKRGRKNGKSVLMSRKIKRIWRIDLPINFPFFLSRLFRMEVGFGDLEELKADLWSRIFQLPSRQSSSQLQSWASQPPRCCSMGVVCTMSSISSATHGLEIAPQLCLTDKLSSSSEVKRSDYRLPQSWLCRLFLSWRQHATLSSFWSQYHSPTLSNWQVEKTIKALILWSHITSFL